MPPLSPLPSPAISPATTAWLIAKRNKKRRDAARAEQPEVLSSACSGTTLVQTVLKPGGVVEVIETPDSPTCGGGGTSHGIQTETGIDLATEDGQVIIPE